MAILKVRDVFAFQAGKTLVVGDLSGGPPRIGPCEVRVYLRGEPVGTLQIDSERMPGPNAPEGERVLESQHSVDWRREDVEAGDYELRW